MNSVLFQAHKEYRTRAADERYSTLKELHEVTSARREASVASTVSPNALRFSVSDDNVVLQGGQSLAIPTHWALTQLCDSNMLDVPAPFIRRIPGELAAENLNWAAQHAPREAMSMVWANGSMPGIVRCFTSPGYGRVWDNDFVNIIRTLTQDETNGWHRPPAYTDDKYPSGYYASDRNVFMFCVNEDKQIDNGKNGGMNRGFFAWNSEVRQLSWGLSAFLYERVCGNHLVWGAETLFQVRGIHMGKEINSRVVRELTTTLTKYLDAAPQEQIIINAAREKQVAAKRDEAVTWLRQKTFGWNDSQATRIVEKAEENGDDPTKLYSLVYAATQVSQERGYTDERTNMDRKAGRMLEVAF